MQKYPYSSNDIVVTNTSQFDKHTHSYTTYIYLSPPKEKHPTDYCLWRDMPCQPWGGSLTRRSALAANARAAPARVTCFDCSRPTANFTGICGQSQRRMKLLWIFCCYEDYLYNHQKVHPSGYSVTLSVSSLSAFTFVRYSPVVRLPLIS